MKGAVPVGIDVFFTGLMLICLKDDKDCPTRTGWNTAWVAKANGPQKTCGWYNTVKTRLQLEFLADDFELDPPESKYCEEVEEEAVKVVRCQIPEGNICLEPDDFERRNHIDYDSLEGLPRLYEIDQRSNGLRENRLKDSSYTPTSLDFRTGMIRAGDLWPSSSPYTCWYRSDCREDQYFPRALSDSLKVTYKYARRLRLYSCAGGPFSIVIYRISEADEVAVTIRNLANTLRLSRLPKAPGMGPVLQDPAEQAEVFFDVLPYLLWYYRLGYWEKRRGDMRREECPEYTFERRNAVLLGCMSEEPKRDESCINKATPRQTTFWPPMLGGIERRRWLATQDSCQPCDADIRLPLEPQRE